MSRLTGYQKPGLVAASESPKLSDVFTKHEGQLFETSTDSDQYDISENLGLIAIFALTALGGLMSRSSDQTSSSETDGSMATDGLTSARFIDAPVAGIEVYQNGNLVATTATDGSFSYSPDQGEITFRVGSMTLGQMDVASLPTDSIVTPYDLAGVSRETDLAMTISACTVAFFNNFSKFHLIKR